MQSARPIIAAAEKEKRREGKGLIATPTGNGASCPLRGTPTTDGDVAANVSNETRREFYCCCCCCLSVRRSRAFRDSETGRPIPFHTTRAPRDPTFAPSLTVSLSLSLSLSLNSFRKTKKNCRRTARPPSIERRAIGWWRRRGAREAQLPQRTNEALSAARLLASEGIDTQLLNRDLGEVEISLR